MPIAFIAVLVIGIIGVGGYLLTNSDKTTVAPETAEVARAEDVTPAQMDKEGMGMNSEESTEAVIAPNEVVVAMNSDIAISQLDDETAAATTYASSQTYLTPARTSHKIDVNLTIAEDGTIIGANVSYDDKDGYSNPHQERFDGAYQAEVVGMPIADVSLSRVGGASLTSEAFNAAVAEISVQRS